jgi:hypothetical protein
MPLSESSDPRNGQNRPPQSDGVDEFDHRWSELRAVRFHAFVPLGSSTNVTVRGIPVA